MEKIVLPVPAGIRYLEMWNEFTFTSFYNQHVIINKQITGCGFTEKVLRCPEATILCSPRIMLMENKKKQHGDRVFLVKNEDLDSIQANLDYDPSEKKDTIAARSLSKYKSDLEKREVYELKKETSYNRIKNDLYNYLQSLPPNLPPKIIVTYDSAYIVSKILRDWGIIDSYYFIVDEFQAILDDSRFKSGTEIEFLNTLNYVPNVIFVSATPMLDKYIAMLDQFKNLNYYLLDWGIEDKTRIMKPTLKIRGFRGLSGVVREIIQKYLDGDFERVIVERDGRLVEVTSEEAVFYVNSVNHIIRIIKDCKLKPEQVNILCSNTPENQFRIDKKLGKKEGFKIGTVPIYGEPHKMFTFCTRTVYLGADFYSTNARSFIFSDSNSDCLSVDISMDLPQILGRQRLDINPWKNTAEFYYRSTCDYHKMTYEDLMNRIKYKEERTESLLRSYDRALDTDKSTLADKYLNGIFSQRYTDDYVAVDRKSDKTLHPCVNNLVKVNEIRTFEIQQVDYADRFSVLTTIENQFDKINEMNDECVVQFFKVYDGLGTYLERIQFLCEWLIAYPETKDSIMNNLNETDKVRQHVKALDEYKIKSLGYNITQINQAISVTIFDQRLLDNAIYNTFHEGERWSKANIKIALKTMYNNLNYKKTPKANDIENYFEVREINLTRKEGTRVKRDAGYELVKSKQDLNIPGKYLE